MDNDYKCNSNDNESIPEEVLSNLKLDFEAVHQDAIKMAALSKGIKEYNKDLICRVPFCNTLEAESLGSRVKFSDPCIQARIGSFRINEIKDIYELEAMDFNKGSIVQTLKAVEYLNRQGEKVCVQVEGPFTIANQLMDSGLFYKSIVKEKEAMEYLFNVIEAGILQYIEKAVSVGASIISYADPAGTIDLVGPRVYKNYSGKLNWRILKKAEALLGDSLVHLCGRTSSSLERGGFAKRQQVDVKNGMSYGEGVFEIINNCRDIKIIGNGCIKLSHLKNMKNCIWRMDLS